jgi:hypothetical protein
MQHIILKRTARAVLYIVSIGGLLFCSAGLIWGMWNVFLSKHETVPDLSFLEAMGLIAVAYVITSGVQFANEDADKPSRLKQTILQKRDEMAVKLKPERHFVEDACKNMTPEQRKQLIEELGKCCGKNKSESLKTEIVVTPKHQEEHIG